MRAQGRTIIFVSHDTNAVKRMCQSAVLLERGELLMRGAPNDVTNVYTKLITSPHGAETIRADIAALASSAPAVPADTTAPDHPADATPAPLAPLETSLQLVADERAHQQVSDREYTYGGENGKIVSVTLTDDTDAARLSFIAGSQVRVRLRCTATVEVPDPIYAVTIKGVNGQEIFGTNTYFQDIACPPVGAGETTEATFELALNLQPGVYFISAGWVRIVNTEVVVIQRRYDVIRFDVLPRDRSFGVAYCPTKISVAPRRAVS
jgi:hypothetical protein